METSPRCWLSVPATRFTIPRRLSPRPAAGFTLRASGSGALAGGNALIALGVLILSSGGLLEGVIAHDEAFVISLAVGISVIYAGFVVASGGRLARGDKARRTTLPANVRGNDSTISTRVGSL